MIPSRGLDTEIRAGRKQPKTRITVLFICNATGTDKREPLFIGKAAKPRCFGYRTVEQHGFAYRHNAKAWMTTLIYNDMLKGWDDELHRKRRSDGSHRKILLVHNNFAGHRVEIDLRHITAINLAPNLTSAVQPLDQGIISNVKAHYRGAITMRALNRYEAEIPAEQVYKIDQLEAMRLIKQSWNHVTTNTIFKCWRKAGILHASMQWSANDQARPVTV